MIPHNFPSLGCDEQAAASRALLSGWIAQGSEVEAFENELCDFFNIPHGHALAVSSGSAALYMALWALEGENKRIGLPVYACAALRNAIGLIGAEPVYLDCDKGTPNIDASVANLPDVDILIAPSMFGIPVNLPVKPNCKVIEDIAQSLGAISFGQRIGLRGDIGVCSFYATKIITSGGQGGALISHNKALIDALRDYRAFDCRDDSKLRFNFQMTDLQAAVGRVQLVKLPGFLRQREQIFEIYREAELNLFCNDSNGQIPVRYRAVIQCEDAGHIIQALAEEGVRAIVPVERWELLSEPDSYPKANWIAQHTVSLPIYPSLGMINARKIAMTVRKSI